MNNFKGMMLLVAMVLCTGVAAAGQVGGPKTHIDVVAAFQTDVYKLRFYGEQVARIHVSGDGDSDLDCIVLDQGGHGVAVDTDNTDDCLLVWTPAWTGQFTLKIINHGGANRYVVSTN